MSQRSKTKKAVRNEMAESSSTRKESWLKRVFPAKQKSKMASLLFKNIEGPIREMKVPIRKRILKNELSGKEFHNYSQNTSKARADLAEESN